MESLPYGKAQIDGRGRVTEDRIAVLENEILGVNLYAVFDGHAGTDVAEYAKTNLLTRIMRDITQVGKEQKATLNISPVTLKKVLERAFIEFDQELYNREFNASGPIKDSGCTATVAVVTPSSIILAHVGDSPGIVFNKQTGTLKGAIGKHIPNPEGQESDRIIDSGGVVKIDEHGVPRINGLMVSRAFGDFSLKFKNRPPDSTTDWTKLAITADPTIVSVDRDSNSILAICSDGLIEQYKSLKLKRDQELATGLASILKKSLYKLEVAAEAALNTQVATMPQPYKGDDLSLILVDVSLSPSLQGGGRKSRRRKQRTKRRSSSRRDRRSRRRRA